MSKLNPNANSFVPKFATSAPAQPAPKAVVNQSSPTQEQPHSKEVSQKEAPASWEDEEEKPKKDEVPATSSPSLVSPPNKTPSKPSVENKETKVEEELLPDDLELEAEELTLEDAKLEVNEDELDDPRDNLNIIFIGHVDAGKSTLSGQLLYLTGMVDERLIQKYEQQAKENNRGTWFFAYVMDTNEEERAKGKTVEVGKAHFSTEKKRYTILDAPGHKNYVPNMIGGVAQADVGILIISARTGEFEAGFDKGGQTREHAQLAKTLGVRSLIVAINKMDDPSVGWSKERYDEIVNKLAPFLQKEVRYNLKKDVIFLPLSGFSGVNVKDPVPESVCPWYTERKSLIQVLDNLVPAERDENGPVRVPVQDKYKDMGNTMLIGKVESGSITKGQRLLLMPNKVPVRVLGLFVDTKQIRKAKPGENLSIALSGVEETDISTGFVLCDSQSPVKVAHEFEAQIVILELPVKVFTAGYSAVIHIHTAVRECTVTDLICEYDKKTNKPMKKKPMFVKTGAVVNVRISLAAPTCMELFDQFQQLGRFTLRDKGKTIAIGKAIKIIETK